MSPIISGERGRNRHERIDRSNGAGYSSDSSGVSELLVAITRGIEVGFNLLNIGYIISTINSLMSCNRESTYFSIVELRYCKEFRYCAIDRKLLA